ncbi:GTPases - Sulfate adenylate transferase subunit 1 [Methanosarcina sp. WWM596]|nr:GTPases - Sulfate adenylate transferase subunit 1 [Methanosarcina sp. WWM596]AKB20628.1 GTPases - Sulfate adenylate transferase subunit 1 [Methanosarcina sp. WH1]
MIKNKIGIGTLILTILLVCMALIPAVSSQEEKDYSVTAEEAFKHANAHMISFIAADAPYFERN